MKNHAGDSQKPENSAKITIDLQIAIVIDATEKKTTRRITMMDRSHLRGSWTYLQVVNERGRISRKRWYGHFHAIKQQRGPRRGNDAAHWVSDRVSRKTNIRKRSIFNGAPVVATGGSVDGMSHLEWIFQRRKIRSMYRIQNWTLDSA